MGDIEYTKITIEFTITEARILAMAIASHNPPKRDEMVAFMLYNRIVLKIKEIEEKNELS